MKFAAAIFDRDHTLLAFDSARVEAIQARINSIAPELPPSAVLHFWNSWLWLWPPQPVKAISGLTYHSILNDRPASLPCPHSLGAAGLRLPPSACLFVDDLSENVAAARSIGMEALQIDRTRIDGNLTNSVIATLTGLPRAVLPPI